MGKLVIESLQKRVKLKKLLKAVYKVTGQTAKLKAELVFEEADAMRDLNRNSRNVDSVTDVLSFPMFDGIRGIALTPEMCRTEMEGRYIFIGS